MSGFKLKSEYKPTGDQPEAIAKLVEGVRRGDRDQTLLGVTGSGKTFTMANIIKEVNKPTLVLAHNKTLAAQLCSEVRAFFPDAANLNPAIYRATKNGAVTNFILLGFEGLLLLSEGLKFFVFQNGHRPTVFFVINVISACAILFCSAGTYPIIIYIVIHN